MNKVAIITGASRGIGQATAIQFAMANYNVTLIGKDEAALLETNKKIKACTHVDTLICVGDISDFDFLKSTVQQTEAKWGRIDAVINNAAWRTIETMRTIALDTWEQTLKICVTAPAFLAKWSAEIMERLKIEGAIINISSIMSELPAGNSPAYITAKGALESLTRELAVTYGRSGIRVLCVNPGFIETDLSKDYKSADGSNISDEMGSYLVNATPLGRPGTPQEVANTICWLASEQASFITGTTLLIDGGVSHNLNSYILKNKQFPKEY
jgi:NAD(P)-dependent dehydrogenase (short-subunit alcohol dehydrogenase family)